MFTGLIEAVGTIARIEESPAGLRLSVATDLADALAPGDSLAINGVCLTVVGTSGGHALADVSPETITPDWKFAKLWLLRELTKKRR